MNENPGGTPNPLNPGFGAVNPPKPEEKSEAKPMGTGTLDHETAPVHTEPIVQEVPVTKPLPHRNNKVVDPMMRPVAQPQQPQAAEQPIDNFDTLAMESISIEELTSDPIDDGPKTPVNGPAMPAKSAGVPTSTPVNTSFNAMNPQSDFVPKDSIVESGDKKGGKKKAFAIGAIVFLMIAIICGAAAFAIILMNNNGDKVAKAIDKLMNGGIPNIVSAQGTIDMNFGGFYDTQASAINTTPTPTAANLDFNGAVDFASNASKIKVKATLSYSDGDDALINIDELNTKNGDSYFKISGLDALLTAMTPGAAPSGTESTPSADDITNCVGMEGANCGVISTGDITTTAGLLSIYSELIETVDDQWILVSDDFGNSMEGLELFNNSSACLVNAFSTLPTYSKDLANKYKENSFITYSTDNLGITKSKNDLYKLSVDSDKLAAFINSLSNNGFMNELNACTGSTATNFNVSADMITEIFKYFPTVYVEVDNDYNFTRVYFDANMGIISAKADIQLSYPSKIEVTEPEDYIEMSTLLTGMMTGILSGGENNTNQ